MDGIFDFIKELVNPESIINYGGIYLLLFVVFAETGLFVGFFLPGDSLLFTAGLFCSAGILQIHLLLLIAAIIVAAVSGNMVGYSFGKNVGVLLFKRKSGFFFKQKHLVLANEYYIKYGKKTIILSRFLPIVRTFAPIVAGIVKLEYHKFFLYSLIGAFFWVTSLVLMGYFMGEYIPKTKEYLEYIVIFLIVITSIPFISNYLKKKFENRNRNTEEKKKNGKY
jgi:membrane-associated protein